LFSFFVHAEAPQKWEHTRSIVERHEFYQNNEEIIKPANTWQLLFALTFIDSNLSLSKDCIFFRVPGDEPGKIKIKSMASDRDCSNEILAAGDIELEQITSLKFETNENSAVLDFHQNGKKDRWMIQVAKEWKRPEPKTLLSSADFKSPRMIYLASSTATARKLSGLKDGVLCHDVTSDCSEKSVSHCHDCEHGWMELPNGCVIGPKVCGPLKCGGKDQPACRRGMAWQRKEMTFDCRTNSSFAWCSKGLKVTCEGDRANCR
jgi:hypothetical protein